jgi:hypothetical protein
MVKTAGIVPNLLQFNAREGTRLGLGLKTSPKLFSHLSAYGYAAYGFMDESWKYAPSHDAAFYESCPISSDHSIQRWGGNRRFRGEKVPDL